MLRRKVVIERRVGACSNLTVHPLRLSDTLSQFGVDQFMHKVATPRAERCRKLPMQH